jgi:hypothetical protein
MPNAAIQYGPPFSLSALTWIILYFPYIQYNKNTCTNHSARPVPTWSISEMFLQQPERKQFIFLFDFCFIRWRGEEDR